MPISSKNETMQACKCTNKTEIRYEAGWQCVRAAVLQCVRAAVFSMNMYKGK